MVGRKKGEPVRIFLNTSILPLSFPLPEKLFLMSKCQMSKYQKVWCRRVSRAQHVCLTLRVQSRMGGVSDEVNCHNWPIIGYTKS